MVLQSSAKKPHVLEGSQQRSLPMEEGLYHNSTDIIVSVPFNIKQSR